MKIKLTVAYDGTDYGGWQVQKNKVAIQQKMEEAAKAVFGKKVAVVASGRTDSGVHAAGQVCHLSVDTTIPPEKIADAFNANLPDDISVLQSSAAEENFDANRSAKRKTYAYKMYLSPRRNPLKERYSEQVKFSVETAKLRHIAGCFVGKHDFKAYCKSGSSAKTTVREIYSIEVKEEGEDLTVFVCGGGFLYNMVRTIVGTMLYYATGVLSEEDIKKSLETGDRNSVGKTMPAKGLTLVSVEYD